MVELGLVVVVVPGVGLHLEGVGCVGGPFVVSVNLREALVLSPFLHIWVAGP